MKPQPPLLHRRILLVDDNNAIHADFRKILLGEADASENFDALSASIFGDVQTAPATGAFEIDSALQGEQALALVERAQKEKRPYALAFVDVRMPPGWDGVETIEKLWAVCPDLQVVLCTAYSDYSWEETIARLGQSDRLVILKKPFDNIEVLQLASALTEKWKLLQLSRVQITTLERLAETRAMELLRSEERYRLIADHSVDIIAVLTPDGGRLYTSPSYERVLGYSREELQSLPTCAQYHPDDQINVLLAMETVSFTRRPQVLEFRMQHRDGTWRAFQAQINVLRDGAGHDGNLIIVARDITDRKAADAVRQQLAAEIAAPAQSLADNLQVVQEGFRDLRVLLAAQQRLIDALKAGHETADLVREVEQAASSTSPTLLAAEMPGTIAETFAGAQRVSELVKDANSGTRSSSPAAA